MIPMHKAVIPVAGLGSRLMPATLATPKPLLPIMDPHGQMTPLIQILVEEVLEAGIEEIAIIISPDSGNRFREFFDSNRLKDTLRKVRDKTTRETMIRRWDQMSGRIKFIPQTSPEGFGHAVFQAAEWVGTEPFMLLLGDHLYRSGTVFSCCRQLMYAFNRTGQTTYGVTRFPAETAHKRGCLAGVQRPESTDIYTVTRIMEKPSLEEVKQHLKSPGLPANTVLALFGCYGFQPVIFEYLAEEVARNLRTHGEIQLTDAMERMREISPAAAVEINGDSLDLGNPCDYRKAFDFLAD